jgi:hypothetical protein
MTLALQPTSKTLPTFHGETWEDHISAWIQALDGINEYQWQLGAIAASVKSRYGDESIKKFAGDVMMSAATIYEFARVYRTYENSERSEILTWSHHAAASYADDPKALLSVAEDEGLSVSKLRQRVQISKGQPETHRLFFNFTPEAVEALQFIMGHCSCADEEAVRKALLFYAAHLRENPNG